MKNVALTVLSLTLFGTASLISSEPLPHENPIPYQGCFQEITPILHKSVIKELGNFEIYLKGVENEERRAFFVKTIIEVVQADPQRYSKNFGSTSAFIAELQSDPLYREKVNQKAEEFKKRENEQ